MSLQLRLEQKEGVTTSKRDDLKHLLEIQLLEHTRLKPMTDYRQQSYQRNLALLLQTKVTGNAF